MLKKSKTVINDAIEEKLEYIGLDLNKRNKELIQTQKINFRISKIDTEKKYKQYRFVDVNDIDILLTPKERMTDLREKYEEARPLYMYLDSKNEKNLLRYTTFLKMLKKVDISDIQTIEKEQKLLSKSLPFKIKYNRNYLWEIYYSESTKRYFMLVPTKETDCSAFFYLIMKKLEGKVNNKIFVPISYLDYDGDVLDKSKLKDLENYLWLFTKDYPSIYEIIDDRGHKSLTIVGESQVYGRIKTLYRVSFDTTKEASKFYKLLKALFILQTELPHYYNFSTNINIDGELKIYLDNSKIEYEILPEFIFEQYMKSISLREKVARDNNNLLVKLEGLKIESIALENDYFSKEKQISTFLECKKSFFGKVKYYFKFGKSNNKKNKRKDEELSEEKFKEMNKSREQKYIPQDNLKIENRRYTLDELIQGFKKLEEIEDKQRTTVMDINALKLKNKNLKKKIENATAYINEINEHKRSIFEFWRYSNKDEVKALEEGEEEEVNVTKIEKDFDFIQDFEEFSEFVDKNQRKKFTDSELDSSFIASTDLIRLINRTYTKNVEGKEFSMAVKELKEQKEKNGGLEEFNIFGRASEDRTKEKNIGSKVHRESPRDKYKILDIKKGSRGVELKKEIINVIKDIKRALKKNSLKEDVYVYKMTSDDLELQGFQVFSLNEEREVNQYLKENKLKRKNNLYRVKLKKGTNFIAFSNIVYYNNKNMTLPVGMHISDRILIDATNIEFEEKNSKVIGKAYLDNNSNDFAKTVIKNINVHELDTVNDKTDMNNKKEI